MSKPLIYLVALALLAGAAYFIWTQAPGLEEPEGIATSTPIVQMTVQTVNEDTSEYAIDAEYPQFGIPSVDAAVKRHVDSAIAAFKDYPASPPEFGMPKNEQDISYGREYIGSDFISTSLVISEYTGGAHPNTVILGVNVDLASGREVTLDGALALIGKNLRQVSAESLASLKAQIGADAIFPEGAEAKAENYSTFLINKDEVTFIFNNYQVASYAAGPQEVSFDRVK